MAREDQRRVQVTLDGVDIGLFDKRTGGKIKGNVGKKKVAGGRTRLFGGRADAPEDITVERVYDKDRDHPNIGLWRKRCGVGEVTVVETLLDADDNPQGRPDTYVGILEEVESPEYDSESNDPQTLKLTVAVRQLI